MYLQHYLDKIYACSPLVAEALAMRDAISLAINLSLSNVIFESDNQTLVEACRKNIVRGEIRIIIDDILKLKSQIQVSGFTWVKRGGNRTAHAIANLAKNNRLSGSWISCPPDLLRSALVNDARALWR